MFGSTLYKLFSGPGEFSNPPVFPLTQHIPGLVMNHTADPPKEPVKYSLCQWLQIGLQTKLVGSLQSEALRALESSIFHYLQDCFSFCPSWRPGVSLWREILCWVFLDFLDSTVLNKDTVLKMRGLKKVRCQMKRSFIHPGRWPEDFSLRRRNIQRKVIQIQLRDTTKCPIWITHLAVKSTSWEVQSTEVYSSTFKHYNMKMQEEAKSSSIKVIFP